MKSFLKLAALVLLIAVLITSVMPGIADFGDFSGDSDYGSDSSDWSSSHDSDWDYGSDSSSESSSSSANRIVIWICIIIIAIRFFLVSALNNYSNSHGSGSSSVRQSTWGFQLRPLSEFKGKQPGISWLRDLYRRMQDAWGEGDLSTLQPDFTADCYAQYDRQLRAKNQRGEKAHCQVLSVDPVIHGWNEDEYEYMMAVEIRAIIISWNTNEHGRIVSGSSTARKEIRYAWVLRKAKESQEQQRQCPNCGAMVDVNFALRCPYCEALLEQTGNGWALSSIQGISQITL